MDTAKTVRSTPGEPVLKWVLIDERPLTRLSFEKLFKSAGRDFTVMAVANPEDVFDAEGHPRSDMQLTIYRTATPSVADAETRAVIASLIERLSGLPLVLLCERDDPEEVRQALAYGVRGYITTSLDPDLVMEALRLVRAGGTFVPPRALQVVVSNASIVEPVGNGGGGNDEADHPIVDGLTEREATVMREIAKGISNKGIARALGIRESTVKVHVRQVMRKLKAANRTQVALLARQWCEDPNLKHQH
jgi:DNA-binding NarL/FixJ family response regulator